MACFAERRTRLAARRRLGRRVARPALAALVAAGLGLVAPVAVGARQPAGAAAETGAPAAGAWSPGPAVDRRVAAEIAARWGVDPGEIRLEWQPSRSTAPVPESAHVELAAGASGATWMVTFRWPDGGAAAEARAWVRAGTERLQPVAARPLGRDETLADADITWTPVVVWGPPVPGTEAVAAGWVTRRAIAAGQPLRAPAVAPPPAVRAGEPVQLVWVGGGVALTLRGRALGTAAEGQKVGVRTDNGRRFEGVAAAPGWVRIDSRTNEPGGSR